MCKTEPQIEIASTWTDRQTDKWVDNKIGAFRCT